MPSLRAALLLLLTQAPLAIAQAPASAPTSAPMPGAGTPDLGGSVAQMLFGLAVVIGLLFACLWLIRRLSAPRGGGAAIRVLGAAAVGPRERVVLVELGEQVLVLGVAPGSVSKLHEMKRSELPLPSAASGAALPGGKAPGGKAFSGWLKQAMDRRDAR